MYGTLTHMSRETLRGVRGVRGGRQLPAALGAVGVVFALAACGTSVASNPSSTSASPTKRKATASPTASPTSSPRPTYTRKASPSPSPTKASPIFVGSLPGAVSAVVGQRIVVQLATEENERWSASGSGGVSVGGTTYSPPPEEQPDAPGTSITTVTAKSAGTATVTFSLRSTNGQANATKKLVVKVK